MVWWQQHRQDKKHSHRLKKMAEIHLTTCFMNNSRTDISLNSVLRTLLISFNVWQRITVVFLLLSTKHIIFNLMKRSWLSHSINCSPSHPNSIWL
jgi:hypothetical protein